MKMEKLENILNSGSFHSDISPEVELALKAKLKRSSIKNTRRDVTIKPLLDFDEINKEALKLVGTEVKYPEKLPKGVVISVRKRLSASTLQL